MHKALMVGTEASFLPQRLHTHLCPCRGNAVQTEVLYSESGQFNPHKARSQKKQARRQKRVTAVAAPGGDDSGSDFDLDTL